MSKYPTHRDKGGTMRNTMAQNQMIAETTWETNKWLSNRTKMCWKCQKESRPEKGCDLLFNTGMHRYVCKGCIDAKMKTRQA